MYLDYIDFSPSRNQIDTESNTDTYSHPYHGIEPMNDLFTFNPIRLGKGLAKAWQRTLYFRLAIRVT